jgi:4-amino-4-deoxy-L-arabinose transferase-like glycosyltransferase
MPIHVRPSSRGRRRLRDGVHVNFTSHGQSKLPGAEKAHPQAAEPISRLVWPLVAFLFCLYLATSSGHTSSNDEDEMYYVTQGIVERRSLALPADEARALALPRGAAVGADGNYYSPYPPLQPVLAIPPYLVGRVAAAAFDPRFEGLVTRAVVTLLPAAATALTAGLVALLARDLGASASGAAFLGLVYGTATIAWPYARSFWSEPLATLLATLAAWCALRGSRGSDWRYWCLAALCLGLAVATRWAMIVLVLPLGVYLVVATLLIDTPDKRARLARQAAGFVGGLLLPVLVVGMYNLVRFGIPWEGGNGLGVSFSSAISVFAGNPFTGLYGLLLSPGKGLFLYSPPLLAALLAIPAFVRRGRADALLMLGLVGVQIVLVAPLVFWHGDASWGPRYLVPVVPFLLLALSAWLVTPNRLSRWRSAGLAALVALGVVVQVLGSAVNYDTYVLASGGTDGAAAERRWFVPSASPVLGAARQLFDRLALYTRGVGLGEYALGTGFFDSETTDASWPRWTDGDGAIAVHTAPNADAEISLLLEQPDLGAERAHPDVTVALDGRQLSDADVEVARVGSGQYQVRIPLPSVPEDRIRRLELRSPVFVPSHVDPASSDSRRLGVRVRDLGVSSEGLPMAFANVPVVPSLPVSPEQVWSRGAFGWFYDPAVPHLLDVWPWYVGSSGLPQVVVFAIVPVLLALLLASRLLSKRLRLVDCTWRGHTRVLLGSVTVVAVVLGLSAALLSVTPPSVRARGGTPPPLISAPGLGSD